jgi:cyclophilin family peptidyl-prolyl cis-trans isomerase
MKPITTLLALATTLVLACPLLSKAETPDFEMIPPDVTIPAETGTPTAVSQPTGFGFTQQTPASTGTQATTADPQNQKDPIAVITTDKGIITMRLFRKYAPETVANFVELAQKGFYNGLTFHRVEPGFVIQGGCPYGNGSGLYIDPATNKPRFLNLETNANLKHNAPGVVAMARFGKNPNSASCQFYITLAPQPKLDMQYSVFGGVVNGMDIVKQIAKGDKIQSIVIQQ